jgi:hypothetical protein
MPVHELVMAFKSWWTVGRLDSAEAGIWLVGSSLSLCYQQPSVVLDSRIAEVYTVQLTYRYGRSVVAALSHNVAPILSPLRRRKVSAGSL